MDEFLISFILSFNVGETVRQVFNTKRAMLSYEFYIVFIKAVFLFFWVCFFLFFSTCA